MPIKEEASAKAGGKWMKKVQRILAILFLCLIFFLMDTPRASADWKIVYSDRLLNAMRQAGYSPPPKYQGSFRTKAECANALARASTGGFNRYGNEAW
ncbi:MAG: hypothetical protein DRH43_07375 [Deltaproteobacteria bacterium]|nr:MAG: hypothetical protein DRH43_07375 [Deltaproteobacteria bacterium]